MAACNKSRLIVMAPQESHRIIAEIRTTQEDERIATVRVGDQARPIVLEIDPAFDERSREWRRVVVRLIRHINTRVQQSGCFEDFDGKAVLVRNPDNLCIVQAIDRLVQRIGVGMAKVCIVENS